MSLAGLTVVDASGMVAGPFCCQILRWLGADVYRVGPPGEDPLQGFIATDHAFGMAVADYVNSGKTAVPSTTRSWASELENLLASADVLVLDLIPQQLEHAGLDLDALRLRYPKLVVVSVTGHGLTGPKANWPWTELTAYHAGGEGRTLPGPDSLAAFPDRPPVRAGRMLAYYDTGASAAAGVLAALLRLEISGVGDLVEVAGHEVELSLNRTTLSRALYERRDLDRHYRGFDFAGFIRCADGWACVRPSEQAHWLLLVSRIGRPDLGNDPRFADRLERFRHTVELNAELEQWSLPLSREAVRQALLEAGCPGGPYLAPREILTDVYCNSRGILQHHPNGDVAPSRVWQELAADPVAPGPADCSLRRRLNHGRAELGPLHGLRVLDLSWVAAGPYAAEILGFLGADVLKIESREKPDIFRRSGAPDDDLDSSIRFVDLNQGKRSALLDLRSAAGRERLLALSEQADVVLENFRPGVRDRLGLSDEILRSRNPNLVIGALSGFGATAIDADRPGYASVFNAESGVGMLTGFPDGPPTDIRDTNDLRAGTLLTVGVLYGLLNVLLGRGPRTIDMAARDALMVLQGDAILEASRGGNPLRQGNRLPAAAPYDCYPAADNGWVAICVQTAAEWHALIDVVGAIELRRPEWNDARVRVSQRAEIDAVLTRWTGHQQAEDIAAALASAGVPAAKSAQASDIRADPHLRQRLFLSNADHPRFGPVTFVGNPIRLGSLPPRQARRSPLLGEHQPEFNNQDVTHVSAPPKLH